VVYCHMRTYTLTPFVVETPKVQHMIIAEDRGTVFFACETNPLATFKTFGPPEKCPSCAMIYPTSKDAVVEVAAPIVNEFVAETESEETEQ